MMHHRGMHCVADTVATNIAAPQADPGGAVIEVELEARETEWEISPGRLVAGYGFNGQVPGPTIEGRVGDLLVVRLTNSLAEPTTIHWHGLRVPASMDGTEMVQHPVEPGTSFEYRFRLPDAGIFWYHPHMHETEQMERGMYGALVVRGPGEPELDAEKLVIFDDLKLDRKGSIARFGGLAQRSKGRLGQVRLVNGRAGRELEIHAGQVERWRVLNASSSRYVRLSIGGRPFTILGTDGGLIPAPLTVSDAVLAPADRLDIAVGPFSEGEAVGIDSLPYDRGGMVKEEAGHYATLRVGVAAASRAEIPSVLRRIDPLVTDPVTPNRTIPLGIRMSLRHGVDWTIEGEAHHHADPVKVGDLQVWDIVNQTAMDHPFHLHGFFFQVLEVNGNPPATISWEDTINVPKKGRVRIAWLPDDRPGSWMYHCHILEHAAAGMMAHFDVVR
jgi:FtsP/CotA-like multicopper oxidase with cupredoxin domain